MEELRQILINFLITFITLCAPVITTFVVAWIKAKIKEIESRVKEILTNDQQYTLEWAVKNAVLAAEQSKIKELGINKKEFAMKAAEAFLKAQGLDIDLDVIANAIEAAVWTELNSTDPTKNEALANKMKGTVGTVA